MPSLKGFVLDSLYEATKTAQYRFEVNTDSVRIIKDYNNKLRCHGCDFFSRYTFWGPKCKLFNKRFHPWYFFGEDTNPYILTECEDKFVEKIALYEL